MYIHICIHTYLYIHIYIYISMYLTDMKESLKAVGLRPGHGAKLPAPQRLPGRGGVEGPGGHSGRPALELSECWV